MNKNLGLVERLRWRYKTIEHKFQQYRQSTNETAVADTEYGKVLGAKRLTAYDESYFSFEGIPYAQPPVGELRFKAPQRPTPWEGVRDCTQPKDKSVQVQFVFDKVEGSEDCLYLNVYTNNLSPAKPRAVMVWIHGGGFIIGEANRDWHGPDYFMQKDVILITIQYRLGSLGFLSLNAPELNVPGNAGLKDQVLALKWIKNNCARFGGNPDCITVFGESAGGASTHFMMLTEQTQGLFQRGILQSGCAASSWACDDRSKRAYTLAKLAGYKGEADDKSVLQFLLSAKAKDLIRLEEKVLTPEEHAKKIMFPFGPTIEPYVTSECVVPKHPREMMKTAWSNSIPMMIGNTSYEGLLFLPELKFMPSVTKQLDDGVAFVPAELVDPEGNSGKTKALGLKIREAHVTGEQPTPDNYMDVCTLAYFTFPALRVIRSRLSHAASAPVFLYRYDFDSEELIYPYRLMRMGRGVKGVSHADEVGYQFWSLLAHRLPKDSRDYRNIQRMIGIWTTFAETGNPYNAEINGMDALTWEPLKKTDESFKCLNINDDLKVIDLPEMPKLKIWESLYDEHKDLLY